MVGQEEWVTGGRWGGDGLGGTEYNERQTSRGGVGQNTQQTGKSGQQGAWCGRTRSEQDEVEQGRSG